MFRDLFTKKIVPYRLAAEYFEAFNFKSEVGKKFISNPLKKCLSAVSCKAHESSALNKLKIIKPSCYIIIIIIIIIINGIILLTSRNLS